LRRVIRRYKILQVLILGEVDSEELKNRITIDYNYMKRSKNPVKFERRYSWERKFRKSVVRYAIGR